MGLGQTILTILSLMLMGRLILSMNTTTLDTGMMKDLAEYRIAAVSFGVSRLEKIESKSFDEQTDDVDTITVVSNFSPHSMFGKLKDLSDSGTLEDLDSTFDDVDDYDRFTSSDIINGVPYKDSVTVQYVRLDTTAVKIDTIPRSSSVRTYSKRIRVFVTSDFLIDYSRLTPDGKPYPDTLKFERVISYWHF